MKSNLRPEMFLLLMYFSVVSLAGCEGEVPSVPATSSASSVTNPATTSPGTTSPFCGGQGTQASPYQICTQAQFAKIAEYPSANFKVMNDIYLTSSPPVISEFSGVLDGNQKTVFDLQYTDLTGNSVAWILENNGTIRNLFFNRTNLYGYGIRTGIIGVNKGLIFGVNVTNGAVSADYTDITGVQGGIVADNSGTLENASFHGQMLYRNKVIVGGLVGVNRVSGTVVWSSLAAGSTITRYSGTENWFVGGVVGVNYGTVTNLAGFDSVLVSGGTNTGGIVGVNASGATINGAIMAGSVRSSASNSALGGIAGWNLGTIKKAVTNPGAQVDPQSASGASVGGITGWNDSTGVIEDCASAAALGSAGSGSAGGGVAGEHRGSITRCYAAGGMASYSYTGAICGYNATGATTSVTYYLSTAYVAPGSCGSARTSAQLMTQGNYVGWDFNSVWRILSGETPSLRWPFTFPY